MGRIRVVLRAYAQLIRAFWQLMYGVWRISKLPEPRVSIFGGARFAVNDPYFLKAQELGRRLVELNISVLTGGGPGIMEAPSCGIDRTKYGLKILGVGVNGLDDRPAECVQEHFNMNDFFTRKWLLINYSVAFVVFPGGFGTLDEMSEVLTLIQTKKLKKSPIILVGKEFWKPFMHWLDNEALKHGTVSKQDLTLFVITDDLDMVCCLIQSQCEVVS